MHGYSSPDEIIGRHFSLTQVEADLDKAQQDVEILFSGESIPSGEFSRRYKDGSIGYHTFSAHPLINSAGEVTGLEGFLIDITAHKKVEERLKLLNECFLEFGPKPLENINRLVSLCGEFMGGACALYNRLEDEMLCSWGQWNVPPDYNSVAAPDGHICYDVIKGGSDEVFVIRNLPETGYARTDPNVTRYNLQTYVGIAVKFYGAYVGSLCVVYQKDFLPDEDDKNIMGVIASAIGVEEERRKTEEALLKSEDFTTNILESVDEGFVIIDPEFRIISANKAYCEQVKSPHCDIFGRHCYEVSHHLDRPCFLEGEECTPSHTFKTGMPYATLHTHYDSEGNAIYIEAKSFPVKDTSGNVTAVIETLNNITDRRRLEEQLRHAQKMEAIGTLAGGIAHDFNNMLNIIIGYGALMQMRMKEDDPLLDQLKEILSAGDKAAQLTKGLLLFSRKQVVELKPLNINEILDGFKKMLGRIIGEDIELRIHPSNETLTVMADRGHIEQVLMNLAANARDAMQKGGMLSIETKTIRIDSSFISAHGYGEPGKYALISVTDSGIGMAETIRERIFEPYFTTKGIGSGTGLGLSIVFGIVKQHKGYIHCYSESGKGTTFNIYLPFVKVEGIGSEEPEAATPKGGTETVLVAEDDPTVRKLTKVILEGFGYKVIEAVDGEDAVNKFKENKDKIQLLVFDVIMPKKNGRDAYEDIKGIKHDIKAVFVSGYAADIMQSKGFVEDGMEFISKPVLPNELVRKVREVLDIPD
jgi:PAS domain S-box-containing protein